MTIRLIILWLALCVSLPLSADDQLRGESDHYIVHADLNEKQMREVLQSMEDFHRLLQGQLPFETRPGRKLVFYLEKNGRRITRVSNFRNIGFLGSWPETAASFVVYDPAEEPLTRNQGIFYIQTQFYIENAFFRPVPVWVKTGIPLFFGTAYRDAEDNFILGAPDLRRPMKGSMTGSKLNMLMTTQIPPQTETAWGKFYLLSREAVNPLVIEAEYSGQLEAYLEAYSNGSTMEEAGAVFGDLNQLAKQIQKRRTSNKRTFRQVTLENYPPAEISIRPMTADEADLVEPRFARLRQNNPVKAAKKLKSITARHPDSALAWFEYAAAEFARVQKAQFGGETVFRGFGFSGGELIVSANPYSDAEAWRAVKRALELEPDLAQAVTLKAEILLNRLIKSNDLGDEIGFDTVREMLAPLAANPERNPLSAAVLFQSYIEQGLTPPGEALDLLGRAFAANPAVEEFRYAYAVALARRGQNDVATRLLTSMLNNPSFSEAAKRALEQTP